MVPGDDSDNKLNNRIPYLTAGGIIVTELLLSAIWLPYGVFYNELLRLGTISPKEGLWVPIIFLVVWNISNPLNRKICDYLNDCEYDCHREVTATAVLTISLAIIVGVCLNSTAAESITYGLFGGLSSSLISNQLKEVTYEDFQSKPLLFEGLQQVSKAISLFFMPHVYYYLILRYGVRGAEFLLAALLLHIIPASLVMKRRKFVVNNLSRYTTLQTLHNQETEAVQIISSCAVNSSFVDNDDGDSEVSSDEGELQVTEVITDPEPVKTIVPVYCKNLMGVDILPEIPEEDEIEEEKRENRQIEEMENSIRRLSQLSIKFENLIINEIKNPTFYTTSTDRQPKEQQINLLKKRSTERGYFSSNCCSPYQKYLHKRRIGTIKIFLFVRVLKPLWSTARILPFYLCLATKVTTAVTSVIYVILTPYIATCNEDESIPLTNSAESTMLLSLIAFPWLCFLVFLPWLMNSSKNKIKAIFVLGIMLLGFSTFLVNLRMNYDIIALASLLFGVAYGGLEFSGEIIFKEVVGARRWNNISGPLEILSGLILFGIYCVVYTVDTDLLRLLGCSTTICMLIASLWIYVFLRNVGCANLGL